MGVIMAIFRKIVLSLILLNLFSFVFALNLQNREALHSEIHQCMSKAFYYVDGRNVLADPLNPNRNVQLRNELETLNRTIVYKLKHIDVTFEADAANALKIIHRTVIGNNHCGCNIDGEQVADRGAYALRLVACIKSNLDRKAAVEPYRKNSFFTHLGYRVYGKLRNTYNYIGYLTEQPDVRVGIIGLSGVAALMIGYDLFIDNDPIFTNTFFYLRDRVLNFASWILSRTFEVRHHIREFFVDELFRKQISVAVIGMAGIFAYLDSIDNGSKNTLPAKLCAKIADATNFNNYSKDKQFFITSALALEIGYQILHNESLLYSLIKPYNKDGSQKIGLNIAASGKPLYKWIPIPGIADLGYSIKKHSIFALITLSFGGAAWNRYKNDSRLAQMGIFDKTMRRARLLIEEVGIVSFAALIAHWATTSPVQKNIIP